jgi:predicted transcriptional regulator
MIRDPQRPARLLRAEYDALLPILRRTTAEAFDSATACPRWSVRDVLAHCGAALSRGGNRPDARLHPTQARGATIRSHLITVAARIARRGCGHTHCTCPRTGTASRNG